MEKRAAEVEAVIKSRTRKERVRTATKRGVDISVKRTEGPIRVRRAKNSE